MLISVYELVTRKKVFCTTLEYGFTTSNVYTIGDFHVISPHEVNLLLLASSRYGGYVEYFSFNTTIIITNKSYVNNVSKCNITIVINVQF